ncbi:MAG: hypothetical protein RL417_1128 [Pseudomonadota bacterium]
MRSPGGEIEAAKKPSSIREVSEVRAIESPPSPIGGVAPIVPSGWDRKRFRGRGGRELQQSARFVSSTDYVGGGRIG